MDCVVWSSLTGILRECTQLSDGTQKITSGNIFLGYKSTKLDRGALSAHIQVKTRASEIRILTQNGCTYVYMVHGRGERFQFYKKSLTFEDIQPTVFTVNKREQRKMDRYFDKRERKLTSVHGVRQIAIPIRVRDRSESPRVLTRTTALKV